MIGTIANASSILIGSILGSTLKKGIGEGYKTVMMDSMGLAATALGVNSIVGAMPNSQYHVLFIVSLALGGLIGTRLSLDTLFDGVVARFSKGSNLAQGLSTAIPLVLASTFGFGIAAAAGVLFCWQGIIYLLAGLIEPYITDALMTEISLVGGILILASGLGILGIKQIKTLNLLPALLIPPAAIALLSLFGI